MLSVASASHLWHWELPVTVRVTTTGAAANPLCPSLRESLHSVSGWPHLWDCVSQVTPMCSRLCVSLCLDLVATCGYPCAHVACAAVLRTHTHTPAHTPVPSPWVGVVFVSGSLRITDPPGPINRASTCVLSLSLKYPVSLVHIRVLACMSLCLWIWNTIY